MLKVEMKISGIQELGENSGMHQVTMIVVDTPENRAVFGGNVPRGQMVLIGLPEVDHIYQQRQVVTIEAPDPNARRGPRGTQGGGPQQ
jgi:hypothetical protein